MSQTSPRVDQPPKHPAIGCLLRLFWMMAGYVILIFAAISITRKPAAFRLSSADVVFWGVVACMIAARYWDIAHLGGRTSDGDRPATLADWKRYSLLLAAAMFGIWLALNAVPIYRG